MFEFTDEEKDIIMGLNISSKEREIISSVINEDRAIEVIKGQKYLTKEHSEIVAKKYNLDWNSSLSFGVMEFINLVVDMERAKNIDASFKELEDGAELPIEMTPSESVVNFLRFYDKDLTDGSLTNEYLEELARELVKTVDGSQEELTEGIIKAGNEGLISSKTQSLILTEMNDKKNEQSLIKRINEEYENASDKEEALSKIAPIIIDACNELQRYVDVGSVIEESLIKEYKEEMDAAIYNQLCLDVIEYAKLLDYDLAAVYDQIMLYRIEFDINRILEELSTKEELNFNLDDFRYQVYAQTDEKNIFQILKAASEVELAKRSELTEDIAEALSIYVMHWPEEMIIDSIKKFEHTPPRCFLPYEEICNKLMNKQVDEIELAEKIQSISSLHSYDSMMEELDSEQEDIVESISNAIDEEIKDEELEMVEAIDAALNGNTSLEDTVVYNHAKNEAIVYVEPEIPEIDIEESVEELTSEEPKVIRIKIKNRKKAKGAVKTKKIIAAILFASGMIATPVLVSEYGITPMVAAQNCWDSISALFSGAGSLRQFLPDNAEGIKIFAGIGTVIGGLIVYSRAGKQEEQLIKEAENVR